MNVYNGLSSKKMDLEYQIQILGEVLLHINLLTIDKWIFMVCQHA